MSDEIFELPELKIWIIYQGKKSKEIYDDLTMYFNQLSGRKIALIGKLSEMDDSAKNTIESNLQEQIMSCDYAFAIIDEDPRDTIIAGNLWFEVGRFIGYRGWDRLTFFKQQDITQWISDIDNTRIRKDFSDYTSLIDKIRTKINDIRENITISKTSVLNQKEKIQITYNHKEDTQSVWLLPESYQCNNCENECITKLNHLSFSSELFNIDIENEIYFQFNNFFNSIQITRSELININEIISAPDFSQNITLWTRQTEILQNCIIEFYNHLRNLSIISGYIYEDPGSGDAFLKSFIISKIKDFSLHDLLDEYLSNLKKFKKATRNIKESNRLELLKDLKNVTDFNSYLITSLLGAWNELFKIHPNFIQEIGKCYKNPHLVHNVLPNLTTFLSEEIQEYFNNVWKIKHNQWQNRKNFENEKN